MSRTLWEIVALYLLPSIVIPCWLIWRRNIFHGHSHDHAATHDQLRK